MDDSLTVTRTYKYRLYPTTGQRSALLGALDACRWVYNQALEARREAWASRRERLSRFHTVRRIPGWKAEHPFLNQAFSQSLQEACKRVDLAFQAFFRRVKAGETPGYPRFKGRGWYDSITYPQYGNGVKLVDDRLYLSKIGHVRVKLHRPVEGIIKTVTVRRDAVGHWVVRALNHACQRAVHRRTPFAHQAARRLVDAYQVDLDIHDLQSNGNRAVNRGLADVAWGQFVRFTTYKAESAGRVVLRVPPRGTTQACSGCGAMVPKDLHVRVHACPRCGLRMDRDLNAARNILARGLASLRPGPVEAPSVSCGE